jgi:hypothetical protein
MNMPRRLKDSHRRLGDDPGCWVVMALIASGEEAPSYRLAPRTVKLFGKE